MTNFAQQTKRQYRAHASDFLEFAAGTDWLDPKVGRQVVERYIAHLKATRKISQAQINYIIRGAVAKLYSIKGLKLPVILPRLDPAVMSNNPALFWKDVQVETMVHVAREMDAQIKAVMAVATVYAPRLNEIIKLSPDSVDKEKHLIHIQTLKHNLYRHHLIPEVIRPALYAYDWTPLTEHFLRDRFDALIEAAGIKRLERQSFHAFRHWLWNELEYRGFTEEDIYKFVGWRRGNTLGSYVKPMQLNIPNDLKIFEKHPSLIYWS
jgi:integrase